MISRARLNHPVLINANVQEFGEPMDTDTILESSRRKRTMTSPPLPRILREVTKLKNHFQP